MHSAVIMWGAVQHFISFLLLYGLGPLACSGWEFTALSINASVWNFCPTTELTQQFLTAGHVPTLGHVQHNYSIFCSIIDHACFESEFILIPVKVAECVMLF